MADKINNLDKLFKSTLANHAVTPEPAVWDKLSNRLDNKEKPVILVWWKWVAAAAVVIISCWLMYQPTDQTLKNIASLSVGDTKFIEKTPFSVPPTRKIMGKGMDKLPDANSHTGSKKIETPNNPTTKKAEPFAVEKMAEPKAERTREQRHQVLEDIDTPKRDVLTTPTINQHAFDPTIALMEEEKKDTNGDYSVKIVSNGYAIQPEKEKLVEGLENKIGGFFTKVDEGFGGLQDAKNNLFASLTTKRDKKKN
ncbi:hypothetical protein [Cyclobacterium qasimii]|uniref:Uncharacterized protein n=2 Tax=Cyclobacterium qasimii TaxID=1350429 RepID=S7WLA4_9BACT|nr:hypothetical protein [Cyclobacterium qasimii]EPR67509.1 hypothetical protein ADICYQ_3533 [Cyclobacterium qasimii M12-11B]GEO21750.1 hypothetical protein CQA01_22840 [Cyclobacterium qasimii]